jgi:hypothetical protein
MTDVAAQYNDEPQRGLVSVNETVEGAVMPY